MRPFVALSGAISCGLEREVRLVCWVSNVNLISAKRPNVPSCVIVYLYFQPVVLLFCITDILLCRVSKKLLYTSCKHASAVGTMGQYHIFIHSMDP
jgi:hypothetical protein